MDSVVAKHIASQFDHIDIAVLQIDLVHITHSIAISIGSFDQAHSFVVDTIEGIVTTGNTAVTAVIVDSWHPCFEV